MENVKKVGGNWTAVPNDIINSQVLSFGAKALWAYVWSKPKGWEFSVNGVVAQSSDTRHKILKYVKELEDAKLLLRIQAKSKQGKFGKSTWIIDSKTVCRNTDDGFSDDGFSDDGIFDTSNTILSNTINSKTIGRTQFKLLNHFLDKLSKWENDKITLLVEWLEYRKEIKRMFKSKKSISQLIKQFEDSENKDIKAAVRKSISNQWQGLFIDDNMSSTPNDDGTDLGNHKEIYTSIDNYVSKLPNIKKGYTKAQFQKLIKIDFSQKVKLHFGNRQNQYLKEIKRIITELNSNSFKAKEVACLFDYTTTQLSKAV